MHVNARDRATVLGTAERVNTLLRALVRSRTCSIGHRHFRNRSQAIEAAIAEKLKRLARTRLATECAKLDPAEEQQMADEGLAGDAWPEY